MRLRMKRILFDQNVPHRLARHLAPRQVALSVDLGWSTLSNGKLVDAAERAGFDVLLTADQNMAYQQNLTDRHLAILILDSNRWPHIFRNVARIRAAIDAAVPAGFNVVRVYDG